MATLLGKTVMKMLPTKSLRRAVVKAASEKMRWRLALPCEEKYWADYISQKGGEAYGADLAARLNPELPLQEHVREQIEPGETVVRILDVGAGPLTVLGKRWEGRTVEITAVEPLANDYARILRTHGVTPVVPTQFCEGERVAERFAKDHFDVAYSRNALDHSYEPVKAIGAMVEVVKPGGCVLLEHFAERGGNGKILRAASVEFHRA